MKMLLLRLLALVTLYVASLCGGPSAHAQESPHGDIKIACEDCHVTTSWKELASPTKFNHDDTRFGLKGQHAGLECSKCHSDLKFPGASSRCVDCHKDVHRGELGASCDRCHTPVTWLVPDMVQRHAGTRFPLLGAHMTAPCRACHINQQKNEYVGVATDCYGCHRMQYESTTVPPHRSSGFNTDCVQCHAATAITWGAGFNHAQTAFPLTGAHGAVPCSQCHQGGRFRGTSLQCVSCHQQDANRVSSPKHVQPSFSNDCASCHTVSSWKPSNFNHSTTRFPLTGAHVTSTCSSCHINGAYAGTAMVCVSCHQLQFNSAANPNHVASGFPTDCQACHTTFGWRPSSFDHAKTQFPLTGAHLAVVCGQCHPNGRYQGSPLQCSGCHQTDYNAVINPKHTAPSFSLDCTLCHSSNAWKPSSFDHNKTQFPLTGEHVHTPCASCHTAGVYAGTPTQCLACHQTDYNRVVSPKHVQPSFSTDCTVCHTTAAWKPSSFTHNATRFPLTGGHVTTTCSSCHINGVYAGTTMVCVSCHQQQFNSTVNPNHITSGFPTDCQACHTTAGWRPASFDHAKTQFPLTGAHAAVLCSQCHANGVYQGTPTQCSSCHLQKYNAVVSPKHTPPSFSLDCTICHTTIAWHPSTFDHNKTSFPLTGDHREVPCVSCHASGVYAGTPTQCSSCHQADFNRAVNPNHVVSGFPTDCTLCHATTGWRPSTFNHATTQFPLTGAHAAVLCTQCHQNNRYQGTPVQCASCHQADFDKVVIPKHMQPSFSLDCTICHSTSTWKPSSFSHSTTRFALTGAHVSTSCASCHINGVYAGTALICVGCHQQQFNATTNPNHVTSGFPTDCQACHTTTAWQPATFDHSKTQFPLTGAHLAVACNQCHANGRYQGTPVQCAACHQTNYDGVSSPKHTQPSFSLDCTVCHTTGAWKPSTFNHSNTRFALTGTHVSTACASCHINGLYAGTATACVGCHQQDYNGAANPNHSAAGFPTDCQTCHGTSVWKPSSWNHDSFFPIGSGSHHSPGRWTVCADCHTVQTNFKVFSCVTCHEHSQGNMDPKHSGVSGYTYDSAACYRCHPRGSE